MLLETDMQAPNVLIAERLTLSKSGTKARIWILNFWLMSVMLPVKSTPSETWIQYIKKEEKKGNHVMRSKLDVVYQKFIEA